MRASCNSASAALAAMVLLLGSAAAPRAAQPCDEADPFGPADSTRITLSAADFVDEARDELRSFIATDSLGRVDFAVVSTRPGGIVRAITAVPEVSRVSPYHSEQLKGIAVTVSLVSRKRPATVTVQLRQVCARYFRDSFLYY
ncbi:MAG TPA: hypothetical protein VF007_08850 [Stellaceae bacterium]